MDVGGGGEVIEAALGGVDRRVGFAERLLAGLHMFAGALGGVASLHDLHQRLVHTFLSALDVGADVGQALIGLGKVGDQSGDFGATRMRSVIVGGVRGGARMG